LKKIKKNIVRRYWQNYHPSEKNIDLLSQFYAHLSVNLDLYIVACNIRNELYKHKKERIGKKPKKQMSQEQLDEIEKQKKIIDIQTINNDFLQGGRIVYAESNLPLYNYDNQIKRKSKSKNALLKEKRNNIKKY